MHCLGSWAKGQGTERKYPLLAPTRMQSRELGLSRVPRSVVDKRQSD